jgi:DUF917 family protein
MWRITRQDLLDLAVGAAFLGTGGGGDPYIGRLMVQAALDDGKSVTILDPTEVPDDALVIPTAMMGAPTVLVEKIPVVRRRSRLYESSKSISVGRLSRRCRSNAAASIRRFPCWSAP